MQEIKVEGMTCQGCVRSVTAILARALEVEKDVVEVSLEDGVARFPESGAERVEIAIEKLGRQGFVATTP